MRASTSTSKSGPRAAPLLLALIALTGALGISPRATAADPKPDRTQQPEEEDFQGTPYTQYGEFNEEHEEEEETKFLQRGRLFGASGGIGMQFITGNRGSVYEGGFPAIDLRLHYWFDFSLAMDMQFMIVNHVYDNGSTLFDVAINRIGADMKYYFDITNLSAAITFANPYVLAGLGAYSKTQSNPVSGAQPDVETKIGFSGGLGFEFPIKPRKIYFTTEARIHLVTYADTYNPPAGITDLSGMYFTVTGNFLLTW